MDWSSDIGNLFTNRNKQNAYLNGKTADNNGTSLDVNNDGTVDAKDLNLLKNEEKDLFSKSNFLDINGDEKFNYEDLISLSNIEQDVDNDGVVSEEEVDFFSFMKETVYEKLAKDINKNKKLSVNDMLSLEKDIRELSDTQKSIVGEDLEKIQNRMASNLTAQFYVTEETQTYKDNAKSDAAKIWSAIDELDEMNKSENNPFNNKLENLLEKLDKRVTRTLSETYTDEQIEKLRAGFDISDTDDVEETDDTEDVEETDDTDDVEETDDTDDVEETDDDEEDTTKLDADEKGAIEYISNILNVNYAKATSIVYDDKNRVTEFVINKENALGKKYQSGNKYSVTYNQDGTFFITTTPLSDSGEEVTDSETVKLYTTTGTAYSGTRNDVLYMSGKPFTGQYTADGKWYTNGVINGGINGGLIDGKYYKDGALASGVFENKLYENGSLKPGKVTEDGKLYVDGVPAEGIVDGKIYEAGVEVDMPSYIENFANAYGVSDIYLNEDGTFKGTKLIGGTKKTVEYSDIEKEDGVITKFTETMTLETDSNDNAVVQQINKVEDNIIKSTDIVLKGSTESKDVTISVNPDNAKESTSIDNLVKANVADGNVLSVEISDALTDDITRVRTYEKENGKYTQESETIVLGSIADINQGASLKSFTLSDTVKLTSNDENGVVITNTTVSGISVATKFNADAELETTTVTISGMTDPIVLDSDDQCLLDTVNNLVIITRNSEDGSEQVVYDNEGNQLGQVISYTPAQTAAISTFAAAVNMTGSIGNVTFKDDTTEVESFVADGVTYNVENKENDVVEITSDDGKIVKDFKDNIELYSKVVSATSTTTIERNTDDQITARTVEDSKGIVKSEAYKYVNKTLDTKTIIERDSSDKYTTTSQKLEGESLLSETIIKWSDFAKQLIERKIIKEYEEGVIDSTTEYDGDGKEVGGDKYTWAEQFSITIDNVIDDTTFEGEIDGQKVTISNWVKNENNKYSYDEEIVLNEDNKVVIKASIEDNKQDGKSVVTVNGKGAIEVDFDMTSKTAKTSDAVYVVATETSTTVYDVLDDDFVRQTDYTGETTQTTLVLGEFAKLKANANDSSLTRIAAKEYDFTDDGVELIPDANGKVSITLQGNKETYDITVDTDEVLTLKDDDNVWTLTGSIELNRDDKVSVIKDYDIEDKTFDTTLKIGTTEIEVTGTDVTWQYVAKVPAAGETAEVPAKVVLNYKNNKDSVTETYGVDGKLDSSVTKNEAGKTTQEVEYFADGTTVAKQTDTTYDATTGKVSTVTVQETVVENKVSTTTKVETTYDYTNNKYVVKTFIVDGGADIISKQETFNLETKKITELLTYDTDDTQDKVLTTKFFTYTEADNKLKNTVTYEGTYVTTVDALNVILEEAEYDLTAEEDTVKTLTTWTWNDGVLDKKVTVNNVQSTMTDAQLNEFSDSLLTITQAYYDGLTNQKYVTTSNNVTNNIDYEYLTSTLGYRLVDANGNILVASADDIPTGYVVADGIYNKEGATDKYVLNTELKYPDSLATLIKNGTVKIQKQNATNKAWENKTLSDLFSKVELVDYSADDAALKAIYDSEKSLVADKLACWKKIADANIDEDELEKIQNTLNEKLTNDDSEDDALAQATYDLALVKLQKAAVASYVTKNAAAENPAASQTFVAKMTAKEVIYNYADGSSTCETTDIKEYTYAEDGITLTQVVTNTYNGKYDEKEGATNKLASVLTSDANGLSKTLVTYEFTDKGEPVYEDEEKTTLAVDSTTTFVYGKNNVLQYEQTVDGKLTDDAKTIKLVTYTYDNNTGKVSSTKTVETEWGKNGADVDVEMKVTTTEGTTKTVKERKFADDTKTTYHFETTTYTIGTDKSETRTSLTTSLNGSEKPDTTINYTKNTAGEEIVASTIKYAYTEAAEEKRLSSKKTYGGAVDSTKSDIENKITEDITYSATENDAKGEPKVETTKSYNHINDTSYIMTIKDSTNTAVCGTVLKINGKTIELNENTEKKYVATVQTVSNSNNDVQLVAVTVKKSDNLTSQIFYDMNGEKTTENLVIGSVAIEIPIGATITEDTTAKTVTILKEATEDSPRIELTYSTAATTAASASDVAYAVGDLKSGKLSNDTTEIEIPAKSSVAFYDGGVIVSAPDSSYNVYNNKLELTNGYTDIDGITSLDQYKYMVSVLNVFETLTGKAISVNDIQSAAIYSDQLTITKKSDDDSAGVQVIITIDTTNTICPITAYAEIVTLATGITETTSYVGTEFASKVLKFSNGTTIKMTEKMTSTFDKENKEVTVTETVSDNVKVETKYLASGVASYNHLIVDNEGAADQTHDIPTGSVVEFVKDDAGNITGIKATKTIDTTNSVVFNYDANGVFQNIKMKFGYSTTTIAKEGKIVISDTTVSIIDDSMATSYRISDGKCLGANQVPTDADDATYTAEKLFATLLGTTDTSSLKGTKATGKISLKADEGTTVPKGTEFVDADGTVYVTTADATAAITYVKIPAGTKVYSTDNIVSELKEDIYYRPSTTLTSLTLAANTEITGTITGSTTAAKYKLLADTEVIAAQQATLEITVEAKEIGASGNLDKGASLSIPEGKTVSGVQTGTIKVNESLVGGADSKETLLEDDIIDMFNSSTISDELKAILMYLVELDADGYATTLKAAVKAKMTEKVPQLSIAEFMELLGLEKETDKITFDKMQALK